eukprot:SAG31_NODE_4338_length_3342_cov_2.360469_2_plen_41_part_00
MVHGVEFAALTLVWLLQAFASWQPRRHHIWGSDFWGRQHC